MTIRQIKASNPTSDPIKIAVRTQHPIVTHTWYNPEVTVTNGSDSSITITSVELAAQRKTYANKPRQPGSYPFVVPPGKSETLDVSFDLTDDVKKTLFRRPAELRVYYRTRGEGQTARVSVIGGPLDTSTP
jgi:hypothetical protein